jgi:phage terminase large subunit-like protein
MYGVPMRRQDDVDAFFKDRKYDKVMRANIIIPHLVNNAIICGPEIGEGLFDECKNELLAFPDGTHDDFVDVLIDAVKFTYNREVSILDVL